MKERIDMLLVEGGYFESREKAKRHIMAGEIHVAGQPVSKAGALVDTDAEITVKKKDTDYVSRGGKKLEKAIRTFSIDLQNRICMDIGASTGGFTDCMLQNGANRVYSIDVGYGQLDWKLRNDERVVVLERTNIRKLSTAQVPDAIDFFSIDVSFISLKLVFPKLREFGAPDFLCVALIKPQFEVGKGEVGKNGVVREIAKHEHAIYSCIEYAEDNGYAVLDLDFSPIRGPAGNIEFLLYLQATGEQSIPSDRVRAVCEEAHRTFYQKNDTEG